MKSQHKTVAQELKEEFKENYRFHQDSANLRRKAQRLIRDTDAMFAPMLSLRFLFDCLFTIPRVGIVDALRRRDRLGNRAFAMEIVRSFSDSYWRALKHVAPWAGFWIRMLFRWIFDELRNGLRFATYLMLTAIGYLLGAWLVVAVIYFVFTH